MRAMEPYVESRFVEAMLRAPITQDAIDGIKTGMSESGMNLTHARFAKLEIPVPPTSEQKRIADKLDAVLARVDACRNHLDRIPTILKRFRQSVLAAATSGKLTEEWRANQVARMQPQAESGNEAALHSFAWQVGTLANLVIGKPRNGYSPRAVEYKTSVKSLTLTATTSGRFKGEHFKYIDEEISQESHLWLQPGDILIQRANTLESVGVSAVYDGPPSTYIYPDLMMKAKANELVETKFLHYLLLSEPVRRHFRDNATGTAGNMPKINQPTVLSAPVTWPSHEEQTEIVRRVESLIAYADRLEARYTAARAQVEKLTPATLAKAFRGELVPQDPNDEPVSVLLERIHVQRAMRENSGDIKHNRRKKNA
ncbi:MAG: restriction endonuclease subunit S [Gammaproteobacteria bacterium]|nr:restriction endonuclease subunit S [Gammaproteobacteria bacterium]